MILYSCLKVALQLKRWRAAIKVFVCFMFIMCDFVNCTFTSYPFTCYYFLLQISIGSFWKVPFYVVEQTEETTDNPNVSVSGAPQSKAEAINSSTSCTSSKTLVTCSLPSDVHFKLIDDLFPDTDINEVHHHLLCINRNCTGFSKAEKNRQSHLKGKKTITISNMNSQLS